MVIRRFTIGRDRNTDIAIADDSVSRYHAEIWLAPDGALILADRGSSNGTEVIRNGQASPHALGPVLAADEVRFGAVTFKVKDLIDAIESKFPGAMTPMLGTLEKNMPEPKSLVEPQKAAPPPIAPRVASPPKFPANPPPNAWAAAVADHPLPPPLPPLRVSSPPPPPPLRASEPPPPPPLPGGPPSLPRQDSGPLVRCGCGAIKPLGLACPRCHN